MLLVNQRNETKRQALDRPKNSKRNAKRVSKRESGETGLPKNSSDATRGLENTCHSRVSKATPQKGLIITQVSRWTRHPK